MTETKKKDPLQLVIGGRLSYCDAFTPRKYAASDDDSSAKYKTNILVPKTAVKKGGVTFGGPEAIAKIKKAVLLAKSEKFGAKDKSVKIPMSDRCFRDGDARDGDGDPLGNWVAEETADHWVFTCSEKADSPPTTLNRRKGVTTAKDGLIYSGAWAFVVVKLWVQDNTYGQKINANFKTVQHVAHDDKFGDGDGGDGSEMLGSLDDDDDDTGFDLDGDADEDDGY